MADREYPTFENQVLLYAKGWYGHSETKTTYQEVVLSDLKTLLNIYTGGSADVEGVRHFILRTFLKYTTNEHLLFEALEESFGWKWQGFAGIEDRCPEACMLGALSISEGKHVKFDERYKQVFFGSKEEKERINKRADEILEKVKEAMETE